MNLWYFGTIISKYQHSDHSNSKNQLLAIGK